MVTNNQYQQYIIENLKGKSHKCNDKRKSNELQIKFKVFLKSIHSITFVLYFICNIFNITVLSTQSQTDAQQAL